jgi:hypothetical protein
MDLLHCDGFVALRTFDLGRSDQIIALQTANSVFGSAESRSRAAFVLSKSLTEKLNHQANFMWKILLVWIDRMERGEVSGICLAYESLMRETLAREGKINILFQADLRADPRLKDAPIGTDLARSDRDRQVLKLFLARVAIGRPIVAPPGMAPALVKELRTAFDLTMKDPEFLADAKAQALTVDAITGDEIARTIDETYRSSPEIVKRTADILRHIRGTEKR